MTITPMSENNAVDPLHKVDRVVILSALCGIFVLAWIYLISGAGMGVSPINMTVLHGEFASAAQKPVVWTSSRVIQVGAMWWVLTSAILIPAAIQIILLHGAMNRNRPDPVGPISFTLWFLGGYLAVWGLFSLVATAVHWTLEQSAMMSQAFSITDPVKAGIVLIAAGAYQFTGIKQDCLKHIRHPDKHIFQGWQDGAAGAARMGLNLGGYLLGSCWMLIAALFTGGLFNLLCIAGLTGYVMLEKLSSHGRAISIMFGCALVCLGIIIAAMSLRP